MKKKKMIVLILIALLILIGTIIFFTKRTTKTFKIGNNMNSQEIVENILNINSYKATITIDVKSNKNTNKYIMKQQYVSPKTFTQEILEPSNIAGIKITKSERGVKLENSSLNLNTIYENYNQITDSCLDLNTFIEDYKNSNQSQYEEKENEIIMKTKSKSENIYRQDKTLYIDKKRHVPTKMEIEDYNRNILVYISYNEVELNSIKKEDILAFKLYDLPSQI